jgi:D-alanyl-D-alanine carboxypeptidase
MLFDAGSIAKTFEAALTMKLAEAGRLSLEAPISNYLPDYTHVDGAITIRQLLDHSSGVFNVFEHPDFPWVGANVDYSKRWLIEEVISQFVLEPYGPPGAFQHYSSTNYLLLTAIIEEVTGSSVPAEIERQLLIPLDLQQIFVSMGEAPELEHPVAHPWIDTNGDGTLEDLHGIPLTWKATLTHPVLFSTASDLARWMQTLHHDRTVLEPDSYKEMLTFPEVQTLDPEGGLYGLGIVDFSAMLGEEVIGHGGSSLGYSAAALYLPEYGVSIAWLVNTGENPGDLADQIMLDAWLSLSEIISVNQVSLP